MSRKTFLPSHAFTLVEIMIVVAILALLAVVAMPNFLRARKRAQASRILEDLRVIEWAVDQYAIESSKSPGADAGWPDIQRFLKTGSAIYNSQGVDPLGNAYVGFSVDTYPKLSSESYSKLSDVSPADFWSPYYP